MGNSRIVKINPSIYIPPESSFYPQWGNNLPLLHISIYAIGNAAKEILLSSSILP